MKTLIASILLLILTTLSATSAYSAKGKKVKWKSITDDKLVDYLLSNNLSTSEKAALELGKRKSSVSLDSLLQQLLLGHPVKISLAMINALEKRKNPKAFRTLLFYTRHRTATLRIAALQALANLEVKKTSKIYKSVTEALFLGIRDYSPQVRAKAAWFLGKRKVYSAEDDLLKLFHKGSLPAIQALGFIGGIRTAKAFAISLERRKVQKELIVNTIGTMLLRKDFGPEPVRIQLVKILGSINLPGAQVVLLKYSGSGPEKSKRSKKLAYKILSSN
jgi:HEAT repeat protein